MKTVTSLACLLVASGMASAQFGRSGVWMTAGNNAQRSSWVPTDAAIAKDKITSDFQFLWKVQLDKSGVGSPSQPVIMDQYIGYRGFRSLAFMGSVDGGVYAVDTDLNRIEWQKHLASSIPVKTSANCIGSSTAGLTTASVTLPTGSAFPVLRGAETSFVHRSSFAASGVGEPYQGAVTLPATLPLPPPRPAVTATPAPATAPPRVRDPVVLYTVTNDGMFHALYVSNGEEWGSPVQLTPSAPAVRGLIIVNKVAYAVIGEDCASPGNVVALDLSTKEIANWSSDGAMIAGSEGAALAPDGTLYVATGTGSSTYASSVVALDGKTLKPKDWYTAPGKEFTSTPVIFQYKQRVFVAATTRDGRVHLLDSSSLGGANHQTPLAISDPANSPDFAPQALAAFQDTQLTHWLMASSGPAKDGAVMAWKVVDDDHGTPALQTGWVSKNIGFPSAPLVINGVVFTTSNNRVETAPRSSSSVLYALDASTGKELWNSKDSITSSVAALSAGAAHVYVTTNDGALYAFGFPMEH